MLKIQDVLFGSLLNRNIKYNMKNPLSKNTQWFYFIMTDDNGSVFIVCCFTPIFGPKSDKSLSGKSPALVWSIYEAGIEKIFYKVERFLDKDLSTESFNDTLTINLKDIFSFTINFGDQKSYYLKINTEQIYAEFNIEQKCQTYSMLPWGLTGLPYLMRFASYIACCPWGKSIGYIKLKEKGIKLSFLGHCYHEQGRSDYYLGKTLSPYWVWGYVVHPDWMILTFNSGSFIYVNYKGKPLLCGWSIYKYNYKKDSNRRFNHPSLTDLVTEHSFEIDYSGYNINIQTNGSSNMLHLMEGRDTQTEYWSHYIQDVKVTIKGPNINETFPAKHIIETAKACYIEK